MYCSNCGTQLPDDANFCLRCGKPQKAVVPTEPELEPMPTSSSSSSRQKQGPSTFRTIAKWGCLFPLVLTVTLVVVIGSFNLFVPDSPDAITPQTERGKAAATRRSEDDAAPPQATLSADFFARNATAKAAAAAAITPTAVLSATNVASNVATATRLPAAASMNIATPANSPTITQTPLPTNTPTETPIPTSTSTPLPTATTAPTRISLVPPFDTLLVQQQDLSRRDFTVILDALIGAEVNGWSGRVALVDSDSGNESASVIVDLPSELNDNTYDLWLTVTPRQADSLLEDAKIIFSGQVADYSRFLGVLSLTLDNVVIDDVVQPTVTATLAPTASPTPTATLDPSIPRTDVESRIACNMSEYFVKQTLKSPSTAKFPGIMEELDGNGCTALFNQGVWTVSSWVDSQNSFGAMIRTHYVAQLTFDEREETWYLKDLVFVD